MNSKCGVGKGSFANDRMQGKSDSITGFIESAVINRGNEPHNYFIEPYALDFADAQ
jgi:hypothetical protein